METVRPAASHCKSSTRANSPPLICFYCHEAVLSVRCRCCLLLCKVWVCVCVRACFLNTRVFACVRPNNRWKLESRVITNCELYISAYQIRMECSHLIISSLPSLPPSPLSALTPSCWECYHGNGGELSDWLRLPPFFFPLNYGFRCWNCQSASQIRWRGRRRLCEYILINKNGRALRRERKWGWGGGLGVVRGRWGRELAENMMFVSEWGGLRENVAPDRIHSAMPAFVSQARRANIITFKEKGYWL